MRAMVALSLLLGGCVLPQPTSVREQRSDLTPVERLGRWTGERFVQVTPESLSASHLHVIIHGWAPGWGQHVIEDPSLRAWRAVDLGGQPFEPWVAELARAITDTDPHAIIVAYSWLDDAATSRFILAQRNAFARTDLHGRMLARALDAALTADFVGGGGRMHLIGHSYGARVATIAALNLPIKPQQLTLFDTPDAPLTRITGSQANLTELLQQLPIGTGPRRIFVDNYISMIGARYGNAVPGIVDVALTPPYHAFAYRRRHLYPMRFYTRSAVEEFGLGWSPFIAQPPAPGCYEQPWGEMDLRAGCTDEI